MGLDFDPNGRIRYALLVTLAILISIGVGLIVMAPAFFGGTHTPK